MLWSQAYVCVNTTSRRKDIITDVREATTKAWSKLSHATGKEHEEM